MIIKRLNGTLTVTAICELNSANAQSFRSAMVTALSHELQTIEIDLSHTQSVDAAGLGALVSLYEAANQPPSRRVITLRLINPKPTVRQMIELARLHHMFEIGPPETQPGETLPHST